MSYGTNVVIPNGQSSQNLVPTGIQFPTLAVLNPNDGVVYVSANNTTASPNPGSWDWKVPSQSYAILPGTPQWTTCAMYYLDQSGAGHSGEITYYPMYTPIQIPAFQSIGRALTVIGTSLDITESTQPQNPGSGTLRLWADTTNHLHLLASDGTDATVIDTKNYGTTIQTGGDVRGLISNVILSLRNNSAMYGHSADLTEHILFGLMNDNNVWMWNAGGGIFRWLNQAGTVELMRLDNAGNLSIGASLNAGNVTLTGALSVASSVSVGGNLTMLQNHQIIWTDTNSAIQSNGRNTYFDEYNGSWIFRNSATGFPAEMTLSAVGALTVTGGISAAGAIATASFLQAQNGTVYHGPNANVLIVGDGNNLVYRATPGSGHYFQDNTGALAFISSSFIQSGVSVAGVGQIRLPNNTVIGWRNAANNSDVYLGIDNSNQLYIFGVPLGSTATAGANGALPAQVSGYLVCTINGAQRKIPYYQP